MNYSIRALGVAALAAVFLIAHAAPAQTSFGTIVGNVTDETGAVIPGVTVTVTNEGTGSVRVVSSNETGGYTVVSLPPAVYSVESELAGFSKTLQAGIRLEVNQTLRVDLAMSVGQVTEVIDVTAALPQLQTDSSTVAATVDNQKVVELPLNGRSFTQLTMLIPGAVAGTGAMTGFQTSGTAVSVSGLRSEANNYTLDGVNNNESFFKTFGVQPSIDAIQEFRIQTNITSAEFGTAAGANVNVVTKSGTNEFHGSVFEFVRNDNLDASGFFANRSGAEKPEFRQNQFGATVGGPIVRNRTFFFFMYEGQRRSRDSTLLNVVPTNEMFGGDLSRDVVGNPGPEFFDPLTTRQAADGSLTRDPFPDKRVPSSRMNASTSELRQILWSEPNLPGQALNLLNTKAARIDNNQWMGKVDHRFSDKNILTGRYNITDSVSPRPTPHLNIDNNLVNTFTNIMVSDTHTLNPSTVLDVKLGYHRNNLQIADSAPGGAEGIASFINGNGIQGIPILKSEAVPLYPRWSIEGFASPSQTGFPFPDDTYSAIAAMTKIVGNHSIKAGFEFRHNRNLDDGFFTGNMTFNKVPTEDPQNAGPTGSAVAAYLLGMPNNAARNIGRGTTAIMRKEDYSAYVQDDWKITPNLTLNLGVRYDLIEYPKHRDDLLASIDIDTGEFLWDGVNPVTGEPPNARRGIVEPDYNNIAPRFGVAYRLGESSTIRGGYGVFYMTNYLWEAQGIRGNWPFAISETLSNLNEGMEHSFAETTFSPQLDIEMGSTVAPRAQHIVNRNNRISYTQQWNLHVQRQLTDSLMVEIGYVGTKGSKMSAFINTNTAPPGPGLVDPRRPYPQYGAISEMTNEADSIYHGLQFKAEKRFSRGLSFRTNYAFGKTIDMLGAGFSASLSPQNPLDPQADRSLSALHRAHTFSADYVWMLPFGKGRALGAGMGTLPNALFGGWQITGVMTANSGTPINVTIPRDVANIGPRVQAQRPDLVGDPLSGVSGAPEQFLNADAFAEPAPFTFGNAGRNLVTGPSLFQLDFGLYKNFPINERMGFQFRTEYFNAFNNVNFGSPNANIDSPAFGAIGGLASGQAARQIQFGLKFLF